MVNASYIRIEKNNTRLLEKEQCRYLHVHYSGFVLCKLMKTSVLVKLIEAGDTSKNINMESL